MAARVGLPNALTLACLGLSFAIVGAAGQGELALGLRLLAACLLADGLAGRAAKRPGARTDLGAELDSLAALLAYGIAVPLLAFTAGLELQGKLGWAVCGGFGLTTALRLARDNADSPDYPRYQGLPPAAGALILGGALSQGVGGTVLELLMLSIGVLMLSPLKYARLGRPLPALAPLGLLLAAAFVAWPVAWLGLASIGIIYSLSAWAIKTPVPVTTNK